MSASGAPTRRPREVDHVLAPVNDIAIAVGPHGVGLPPVRPLADEAELEHGAQTERGPGDLTAETVRGLLRGTVRTGELPPPASRAA